VRDADKAREFRALQALREAGGVLRLPVLSGQSAISEMQQVLRCAISHGSIQRAKRSNCGDVVKLAYRCAIFSEWGSEGREFKSHRPDHLISSTKSEFHIGRMGIRRIQSP